MGLQRKICFLDTQFLQNEYLRASFFPYRPIFSFLCVICSEFCISQLSFSVQTQNAELPEYAVPCRRCLSEDVDIFQKSAERQGESGHDVRVSRLSTWMSAVGGPVMTRTTHHFSQKIHIRRPYIETCVSHAPGVRQFASLTLNIQKLFFDYFGVNDIIMTYSIQIIFEIKIFCIKIA